MSPSFLPGLMKIIQLRETSERAAWSGPGSRIFRGGAASLIFHGKQRLVSVGYTWTETPVTRKLISTAPGGLDWKLFWYLSHWGQSILGPSRPGADC